MCPGRYFIFCLVVVDAIFVYNNNIIHSIYGGGDLLWLQIVMFVVCVYSVGWLLITIIIIIIIITNRKQKNKRELRKIKSRAHVFTNNNNQSGKIWPSSCVVLLVIAVLTMWFDFVNIFKNNDQNQSEMTTKIWRDWKIWKQVVTLNNFFIIILSGQRVDLKKNNNSNNNNNFFYHLDKNISNLIGIYNFLLVYKLINILFFLSHILAQRRQIHDVK